ncbi:hypothetical protein [Streptomyces sp. NPDC029554]|uniref:hypothetical protein n=1 Tax=Streptomyces sp. NPDC029554 TaxID=3155126 RepID=UPI00340608DA
MTMRFPDFPADVRGAVLIPDDDGYDMDHTDHNTRVNSEPALTVHWSENAGEDAVTVSRASVAWLGETVRVWDAPDQHAAYEACAGRPCALPGAYIALTPDLGEKQRRDGWGGESKYPLLRAIRAAWGPDNLLRHNRSVLEAGTGSHPVEVLR